MCPVNQPEKLKAPVFSSGAPVSLAKYSLYFPKLRKASTTMVTLTTASTAQLTGLNFMI
jgi:hypothetical protein